MSEVTRKPRGQKNGADSAGCPLFEALRCRVNYALKTTTNEFIERTKRSNGQEKEGISFCPGLEVVSSGIGGFCMRQIQGIILGAWRANGNLSSCNLLASLDPLEFVLFHFTDGPDETCPPIAAILPTVRRFCCLSSSFYCTCVFVLCHTTPSSPLSLTG